MRVLYCFVIDGLCFFALLRLTACALYCFVIDGLCFIAIDGFIAINGFIGVAVVGWLYQCSRGAIAVLVFADVAVLVLPIACQYKQVCLLLRLWGLFRTSFLRLFLLSADSLALSTAGFCCRPIVGLSTAYR